MILLRTKTKALRIWENKFLLQDSTHEFYRCLQSWLPNLTRKSLVQLLMSRHAPQFRQGAFQTHGGDKPGPKTCRCLMSSRSLELGFMGETHTPEVSHVAAMQAGPKCFMVC